MVDRWTGRSSCSLWIAGTFWWPCASGHGERRLLCLWIRSILGSWRLLERTPVFPFWSAAPPGDDSMQTDQWRDADPLSSLAPSTAGCRTWDMLRSELPLWFPWTAGHPQPTGDPGGCFWCGMWCCDGWVEVDVGNLDPPLPRLCWGPDSTPADFATDGQSLPGEPPSVSQQHRPAAGTWVAPEDLRSWDTLARPRPPLSDYAQKDCVSWVMVLWMAGWLVDPKRSNTDVLACCVLTFGIFLVTWDVVASLVDFWNVKDPDILSACLMLHTRCCSTLGSGPTTCDPSNGAVRTTLRACGWNPKFFSRASLLSICRLDAAANPEDMAATCASWITANFSLSNLVLSSLGDSSEITDGTRESARDGYMADLLASSSVSMAILWDIWKLACGFQSPNPSVFGGLVKYNTSLCILTLYGSRGNTYFTVKCLNVELSVFSISESVVLSTSSSSLSPCAILAVDAIVSSKEGWSIQETLSVFSSSGRSNRDALTALLVFTGTILKAPSETLDVFSVSSARIAAWKSNGESGRWVWWSSMWRTVRAFETIPIYPGWGSRLSHRRPRPLRHPVPYMTCRQWWRWLPDNCPGSRNGCRSRRVILWLSLVLRYIHHSNEVN